MGRGGERREEGVERREEEVERREEGEGRSWLITGKFPGQCSAEQPAYFSDLEKQI